MSSIQEVADNIRHTATAPVVGINPEVPPSGTGCVECLAGNHPKGAYWLHLRRCAECGHVGCCDSSPNRHATAHFHATRHPIVQSFEYEDAGWFFDYTNPSHRIEGVVLAAPHYHPRNQPAPFYFDR